MSDDPVKTVYMVDDEPDIRTVAEMSLSTIAGWTASMFPEGASMLAHARANPPPDVLVLDVMMPGMDGVTLLGELRKVPGYENTPAVFLTARAQRHEIQGYVGAGAAGVITKPFDPMSLPDRIREFVNDSKPRRPLRPALSDRLAALRERYIAKLPMKLEDMRAGFDAYCDGPNEESHAALRTMAHKLHGTGGSYGLNDVSTAAGKLEAAIIEAGAAGFSDEQRASASAHLEELAQLVARSQQ